MELKGATVFLGVFTIFLVVTLGYPDLPPGRELYGFLGIPETEYSVLEIPATILVSAVFNGVLYGVIAWLIFALIEKARKSKIALTQKEKSSMAEETGDESVELSSTPYLVERIKELQTEIENLRSELRKARGVPSGKIGILFIVPGALSLIFSVLKNSQVLAFIGLGLTFWGALFFFVIPIRYVKSSLLDSSATSSYSTIDRIVKDLKYKEKSYYIPPYPEKVYLPEHLKGLKNMIVFISAHSDTGMPTIEEMAKSSFLLENPKGICLAPPGLGLLTQFEKELRRDLAEFDLNELREILPQLILENLQLAKEIEMKTEKNQLHIKIFDSIYKNLYSREENLKSVHFLGSPLVSAIACAIAKTTGKIVTIQRDRTSPDGQTIEVWYSFIEG